MPSRNQKWNKYTLPIPPNHTWKCSPGYRLFIADRGAVRFEVPEAWLHGPDPDGSIAFRDRPAPDDDVVLKVSLIRLPPGTNVARLEAEMPVEKMILLAMDAGGDEGKHKDRKFDGVVHRVAKPDAAVCWVESTSPDRENGRLIRSRMCLARARGVQPLITMDFYEDLAGQFEPVWANLLRSLWVAVPVAGLSGETAN